MPRKLHPKYGKGIGGDGPSGASFSSSVGPTIVMKRKHDDPDWFADQERVKNFLTSRFYYAFNAYPGCDCMRCVGKHASAAGCKCRACRDTVKAGRWMIVIRMWFVAHFNDTSIEENLNWKRGTVGSIVQDIRAAVDGKRLDGKERTGRRRGRPKLT